MNSDVKNARSDDTVPSGAEKDFSAEMLVAPGRPIKLGSALAKFGREFGGVELDIERDSAPMEPADFE